MPKGLIVSSVEENSIGAEMDIQPGDIIVQINNAEVCDIIDFQYLSADEEFTMYIQKQNNELWQLDIEKYPGESLGIDVCSISTEGLKKCTNNCVFCFVRQMPEGMRESLYDRDDDYRLSFTQGSYITLTNLSEQEFQRIIDYHINPLYISVHAWNPTIRKKMMKNPQAVKLPEQIKRLAEAGLNMHTQIVLVPGYNDGSVLKETVHELANYYPSIQSIGIVPIGLTKHREGLPELRTITPQEAEKVIELSNEWQNKYHQQYGKNLVYVSDEFYFLADKDFPEREVYDGFPQLENGIGLTRLFLDELTDLLPWLPRNISSRSIHIITGTLVSDFFAKIVQTLSFIKGLKIQVHPIKNDYFGHTVTVTGLLTAQDIASQLGRLNGEVFLVPRVMLKADQDIFLDDYDIAWLESQIDGKAIIVDNTARAFIQALLGMDLEVQNK